jgi:phage terminase large subunit
MKQISNIDTESAITLDKFNLRWYQEPIWDAIENKGYKKVIVILPRRAGKDITLWNLAIRQCLRKVCLVHYVLPERGQAKKVVFDAISSDGDRFIDYIPPKLIKSINNTEMKIVFKNNSVLQCVGGETHDKSIRGTNPYMVILSEYAYMKDGSAVYDTVSPILAGNGGIIVMASTPFGKNHFHMQYELAKILPDWFVYFKTIKDTHHIPEEELESERRRMSPEKFAQEYMCSFERGQDGAVFGRCLVNLKQANQITNIAYEPGLLTHCAIDIGVHDATTMIWFQVAGGDSIIRIIDCYSNRGLGLDHYIGVLRSKPYWERMGKIFAPHDIKVREWGGGAVTRYEMARQMGVQFTVLDQIDLQDGLENVMRHFPKFWIDERKCTSLIDALENYYREWDEHLRKYKDKPLHNWASHYCDALRYLCQGLHLTNTGTTPEEFEKKRTQALYGNSRDLPPVFQQPRSQYYR